MKFMHNWVSLVVKVMVFIWIFLNKKLWVPFNARSSRGKETTKTFSFEKLRLSFSFGDGAKSFKFKYPCSLAIALYVKSKHESWSLTFTSTIIKWTTYKPKKHFCVFHGKGMHKKEMEYIVLKDIVVCVHSPTKKKGS